MERDGAARIDELVQALLCGGGLDDERRRQAAEELADHLSSAYDRHLILGKEPRAALAAALRDLGSVAPVERALRRSAWEEVLERGILETLLAALTRRAGTDT